jgi:hypothetical protein
MMSISPDRGQPPYTESLGNIQMAVNTHSCISNEQGGAEVASPFIERKYVKGIVMLFESWSNERDREINTTLKLSLFLGEGLLRIM